MGLIDFIKNVGHKLDHSQQQAKPAQAAPAAQGPSAQDVAKLHERQTEAALANLVNKMGSTSRTWSSTSREPRSP